MGLSANLGGLGGGDPMRFIGGLATTMALLAALHWAPWRRRLTRIEAYILGTLAILAGQGIYLGFSQAWIELATFAVAAGLIVGGAYLYDWIANARVRLGHARQQDDD